MKYLSMPNMMPARPVSGAFVQGFVATGLLAAIQNQTGRPVLDRRALRLALQGGAALAAGSSAAYAWQRQDLGRALTALTLGAAGLVALEHFIKDKNEYKETSDGQEEA